MDENKLLQVGRCFLVNSFEDVLLLGCRHGGEITILRTTEDCVSITLPYQLRLYLLQKGMLEDPTLNCFDVPRDVFVSFMDKGKLQLVDDTYMMSDRLIDPKRKTSKQS